VHSAKGNKTTPILSIKNIVEDPSLVTKVIVFSKDLVPLKFLLGRWSKIFFTFLGKKTVKKTTMKK
jgi:hypothetical protein